MSFLSNQKSEQVGGGSLGATCSGGVPERFHCETEIQKVRRILTIAGTHTGGLAPANLFPDEPRATSKFLAHIPVRQVRVFQFATQLLIGRQQMTGEDACRNQESATFVP